VPTVNVVPSAGAGFVSCYTRRIPGWRPTPAFTNLDIDRDGRTVWLY
jgi:formyltetrahydrofolate synthetase